MIRLSDIHWGESDGLDDIIIWGVDPVITLANWAEEELDKIGAKGQVTERLNYCVGEISLKLADLKACMNRVESERRSEI